MLFLSCVLLCFRTRLFIDALWSPAGKGLTSWISFAMSNCVFVTFPCGIQAQVWYLIVWIPDLCPLSYYFSAQMSCVHGWDPGSIPSQLGVGLFQKLIYSYHCFHVVKWMLVWEWVRISQKWLKFHHHKWHFLEKLITLVAIFFT